MVKYIEYDYTNDKIVLIKTNNYNVINNSLTGIDKFEITYGRGYKPISKTHNTLTSAYSSINLILDDLFSRISDYNKVLLTSNENNNINTYAYVKNNDILCIIYESDINIKINIKSSNIILSVIMTNSTFNNLKGD